MDWPMTEDYCRNLAEAFDIPIYFSWRHGGFKRELLKENDKVAPVSWENPDGTIGTAGGKEGRSQQDGNSRKSHQTCGLDGAVVFSKLM